VGPVPVLHRKFVATVAASLLAAGPLPAKLAMLGVVTHAERARLGEAAVSVGSTIYDGDRLSTETGGVLRISSSALRLQLEAQSSVILRRAATPEDNIQAELGSGTVIFSTGQTGNIAVLADDALIRPVGHAFTLAQIRVVNRKELRIYAQRGALEFSYHGESGVIPEATAYRVLLDPSDREIDAASESGQGRKTPTRVHAKFILLVIGMAAGGVIPVMRHHHHLESPDRP
jgi:hypothetical protein